MEIDQKLIALVILSNVTEYNKMPKMISLQKYANLEYSYFDALYDKVSTVNAQNVLHQTVR